MTDIIGSKLPGPRTVRRIQTKVVNLVPKNKASHRMSVDMTPIKDISRETQVLQLPNQAEPTIKLTYQPSPADSPVMVLHDNRKDFNGGFLSPFILSPATTSNKIFAYAEKLKSSEINSETTDSRTTVVHDLQLKVNLSSVKSTEISPLNDNNARKSLADFEAKLKANFEIEGSTASVSLFGPKSEDRTVENVDKPALEATKNNEVKGTKWTKLNSVFRSLLLFRREEVKNIENIDAIVKEVDHFTLRSKSVEPSFLSHISKGAAMQEALDYRRIIRSFCEAATIGSPNHVAIMKNLLANDPKRYMRDLDDPEHLINHCNQYGYTPMYIAAKNGNLEVLKLLVENKANYLIKSKVYLAESFEESPLEVAVRWNHLMIVEHLLNNCKYDAQTMIKCLQSTPNAMMKRKIREYMRKHHIKRSFNIFICS